MPSVPSRVPRADRGRVRRFDIERYLLARRPAYALQAERLHEIYTGDSLNDFPARAYDIFEWVQAHGMEDLANACLVKVQAYCGRYGRTLEYRRHVRRQDQGRGGLHYPALIAEVNELFRDGQPSVSDFAHFVVCVARVDPISRVNLGPKPNPDSTTLLSIADELLAHIEPHHYTHPLLATLRDTLHLEASTHEPEPAPVPSEPAPASLEPAPTE